MQIVTNIKFNPQSSLSDNSLIGFVDFTYNGSIEFKSIGVHLRADGKGYRLLYPKRKTKEADYHIVRPINRDAQQQIDQLITKKIEAEHGNYYK